MALRTALTGCSPFPESDMAPQQLQEFMRIGESLWLRHESVAPNLTGSNHIKKIKGCNTSDSAT
jgi:hypothetical protein